MSLHLEPAFLHRPAKSAFPLLLLCVNGTDTELGHEGGLAISGFCTITETPFTLPIRQLFPFHCVCVKGSDVESGTEAGRKWHSFGGFLGGASETPDRPFFSACVKGTDLQSLA